MTDSAGPEAEKQPYVRLGPASVVTEVFDCRGFGLQNGEFASVHMAAMMHGKFETASKMPKFGGVVAGKVASSEETGAASVKVTSTVQQMVLVAKDGSNSTKISKKKDKDNN